MHPNLVQGEDVKLSLVSADASGGVSLVVSDANGVDRPIQSYERLLIDTLSAQTLSTTTLAVTDPGASVSADSTLIKQFSSGYGEWNQSKEGLSVSPGSTPLVTASAAGAIRVSGTGRIITAGTRGKQAGYQALLTPGGNVSGNG